MGTYIKPVLSDTHSPNQIFLATLFSDAMGKGPALAVASTVPDIHYFCGRGGRDVLPLYRDIDATKPNITSGLLELLASAYGAPVRAPDLAAYVYALFAGQSYSKRFWNELETPGPRVPLTKDVKSFNAAVDLGKKLLFLQTYGEKFREADAASEVPKGTATSIAPLSSYPEDFSYDPKEEVVRVGAGLFGPVSQEVWEFEVSGLKVVQSWLAYRMKKRFGKRSSALDDIRPGKWRPKMTDEFLELLWMLEATLGLEPELKIALDNVVQGPCFSKAELPTPKPSERLAPGETDPGDLIAMMV